ncbi:serine/threonine-protein kinase [Actinoplanes couchii]|uniref:non-specific serine/threonine protein kinase n=1 Tax=Actinoplanes couchii TaxID=403638 RepID=A0ABQ3WZF0_9ACTN|nr:serine/threonine-protein kinase [Actinoplanes couchii]MDR6316041.1 serine/threonine protein kinase [Actinoplanes couchii]GID51655.1 serine/threonine protein kinase [Actinoplanes couchii]
MPGHSLNGGRYELESLPLPGGTMGQVWPGRDTRLDREVVVKFIRLPRGSSDEALIRRRFRRESQITARLTHPGVPAVYDAGVDEGRPFLVMQRVHGIDIADLIAEHGPLPVGWSAIIAAQVCAVLIAAHRESLVHRDLKPSNVMLEPNGAVKVLDFGLAVEPSRAEYSRITQTGEFAGTPAYMAPEQIEAYRSEPATDLYALGCTLHEMLTGERLFAGTEPYKVMQRHVKDAPPPLRSLRADVPAGLERLVLDLLEKKPEDRPDSATVVYQRLLPMLTDLDPLVEAVVVNAPADPTRLYAAVLSSLSATRPIGGTLS